jgi:hypothetical protein
MPLQRVKVVPTQAGAPGVQVFVTQSALVPLFSQCDETAQVWKGEDVVPAFAQVWTAPPTQSRVPLQITGLHSAPTQAAPVATQSCPPGS